MLKHDLAAINVLQQKVSGTGTFTGVEVGRASRTFGAGGSELVFKARGLGLDGNTYKVALIDPGRTQNTTYVRREGDTHKVYLRHDGAAIVATADEVAALVNNDLELPFYAANGGTGVVAAASVQSLTSGLAPATRYNSQFRFTATTNANGGLFFFDQEEPVRIIGVAGRFTLGGDTAVKVEAVPLTAGLAAIEEEASTMHSATIVQATANFRFDGEFVLHRGEACRVTINAPGVVRVLFHRVPRDANIGVF
jgi:hypothetical protein